jgi:hypothetical protein
MVNSDAYSDMVHNCLAAREAELSWDFQMRRLERHLPAVV